MRRSNSGHHAALMRVTCSASKVTDGSPPVDRQGGRQPEQVERLAAPTSGRRSTTRTTSPRCSPGRDRQLHRHRPVVPLRPRPPRSRRTSRHPARRSILPPKAEIGAVHRALRGRTDGRREAEGVAELAEHRRLALRDVPVGVLVDIPPEQRETAPPGPVSLMAHLAEVVGQRVALHRHHLLGPGDVDVGDELAVSHLELGNGIGQAASGDQVERLLLEPGVAEQVADAAPLEQRAQGDRAVAPAARHLEVPGVDALEQRAVMAAGAVEGPPASALPGDGGQVDERAHQRGARDAEHDVAVAGDEVLRLMDGHTPPAPRPVLHEELDPAREELLQLTQRSGGAV